VQNICFARNSLTYLTLLLTRWHSRESSEDKIWSAERVFDSTVQLGRGDLPSSRWTNQGSRPFSVLAPRTLGRVSEQSVHVQPNRFAVARRLGQAREASLQLLAGFHGRGTGFLGSQDFTEVCCAMVQSRASMD
jgi:hypothetical protein